MTPTLLDTAPPPVAPTLVLLVEDSPADALLARVMLRDALGSFAIRSVPRLADARRALCEGVFDCVLVDLALPDAAGLEALEGILEVAPAVPVVVLTGQQDEALGLRAVLCGAQDYLVKGEMSGPLLRRALRYAMERQQANETLVRMAAIIESSEDAIIAKSLDGIIQAWNGGAERLYGYAAEEVLGRHVSLLASPERRCEQTEILARIARGEQVKHFDTKRLRRDGSEVDVSLQVSPIRDGTGELLGASIVARDITARKQAEERARFQARLLEAVGEAVIATDLDGLVTYWGPAAETLYGWPSEEAIGRSMVETTGRHSRGGSSGPLVELRRRDGCTFLAEVTDTDVFDDDGRVIGSIWVSSDVTEREAAKKALARFADRQAELLEQERQTVQRLTELDHEKDAFVSSVSHELRTPLTSILGYLEMLDDQGGLDPAQRGMVERMARNSRRLLRLIEDLLTVSRLHGGTFRLVLAPVAVDAVVQASVEAVTPTLSGRVLDLSVDVAGDAGSLCADGDQLERALTNLLTNAVKFTPDGGRIEVRARRQGSDVIFEVEDTGIGIPYEDQSKVFRPFFRSSTGDRLAAPGTGLGLMIVGAIVEHHGGRISLRSEPGQGTRTTIVLPADRPS